MLQTAKRQDRKKSMLQSEILGKIVLQPRQATKFIVGIYESTMPEPVLNLIFEPKISECIGATLHRIDSHGDYELIYYLENFGNQACTVSVNAYS